MLTQVDETEFAVDAFMAFTLPVIRSFLEAEGLAYSGNKPELRARIEKSIENETLSLDALVRTLDELMPWSKQHAYLLAAPGRGVSKYKKTKSFLDILKASEVFDLLDAKIPLLLPEELTLSTIERDDGVLSAVAVRRRDYTTREPELDETDELESGEEYELRAFIPKVTRNIVSFSWHLSSGHACLRITELPGSDDYDDIREEFEQLIRPWLDISSFQIVDVSRAIKRLHELEEQNASEARSHGIEYRTVGGRRLSGHSSNKDDSVLGEAVVDDALKNVRGVGVARRSNFYWLSNSSGIERECHVIVLGDKRRVSFKANTTREAVQYVLRRVRELSA